jgi:hypothetical protein
MRVCHPSPVPLKYSTTPPAYTAALPPPWRFWWTVVRRSGEVRGTYLFPRTPLWRLRHSRRVRDPSDMAPQIVGGVWCGKTTPLLAVHRQLPPSVCRTVAVENGNPAVTNAA